MSRILNTTTKSLALHIRNAVYIGVGVKEKLFPKKQSGPVVLCYHSVAADSWRFSIDPEQVKAQIGLLLKTHKPITVQELIAHVLGEKAVTENSFLVTFDDGYKDVYQLKKFFSEKNIKPVLFALSDPEHADRNELDTHRPFLNFSELRELKIAGWEIGCHSATHADFRSLDKDAIEREVVNAKRALELETGFAIEYFAYPKGVYSSPVVRAVKEAGYTAAFSMDDKPIASYGDPYAIPRVGVDRTHSLTQFPLIISPTAVAIRGLIKKL